MGKKSVRLRLALDEEIEKDMDMLKNQLRQITGKSPSNTQLFEI